MFNETVLIVILICAGLVAIPYVLGPVLVFFVQRFRVPPNVIPIDPSSDPLPAEARQYFSEVFTGLTKEGFELVGTMGLLDLVPNVQCILALYLNRKTGDLAMSTLMVATAAGIPTLKTKYVEFHTRFDDGTTVQTNNSKELGAFKQLPKEHTTKFWDIRDIHRLYKIHRLLLSRFAPGRRPILLLERDFGGDALAYVSKEVLEKSFADQVPTGYLRRCPAGYAPTVKGACLMTWQELWPLKAIRKARCQRAAAAVLADLASQLD